VIRRALVVVLVAVLLSPGSASVPAAPMSSARASSQLSFVRGGSIGVASSAGRHVHFLVRKRGRFSYYEPDWSPQGRLAFTIQEETESHAYYSVAVRRPQRRPLIVAGPWEVGAPNWAPDGQRLVLIDDRGMYGGSLNVAHIGGKERSLEPTPGCCSDDEPAWSPNGKLIAFVRARFGPEPDEEYLGSRLFVIRPSGTGLRSLSTASANNPSWSPDSRRIVFDDDGHRLLVINSDGSGVRVLFDGGADDVSDPAWARGGHWIAFVRGNAIWLVTADGKDAHIVLRNADEPAWAKR
jgi:Tol biopolymer transport system component